MSPRRFGSLLAGLAAACAALAQQPAPAPPAFAAPNLTPKGVRATADACAICHGTQGRAAAGSSLAPLAGRPAQSTMDSMKAFRDGKREATVMHQIAKGFGDAEIAALAAYFAAQSKERP
jgi:sulfide dehydrogenase cytochrome subunit